MPGCQPDKHGLNYQFSNEINFSPVESASDRIQLSRGNRTVDLTRLTGNRDMIKIRNIFAATILVIRTFNLTATPLEKPEAVARFDPWGGDRTVADPVADDLDPAMGGQ